MNKNTPEYDLYTKLSYYTLSHKDPSFIHQYIVDAYTAQTADESIKPIAITFALVGLYLSVEKGLSGKEVQRVHMLLGEKPKIFPKIILPKERGNIRVGDVLKAREGEERDKKISQWCKSVWEAYKENRNIIKEYLNSASI